MKRNAILIIGLVLCGAALANFPLLRSKVFTHIQDEEYSWNYVRDNVKDVILEALPDPNDRRSLGRCRNVMKSSLIKWAKSNQERLENKAFLLHIRKAGTDEQVLAVMQRLVNESEVWVNDPNAFLN